MMDEVLLLPDADHPQQLQLNGRNVHSRHPAREAERQSQEILSTKPTAVILLSPGLGFVVDALLTQSALPVLWIEPRSELASVALKRMHDLLAKFKRHGNGPALTFNDSLNRLRLIFMDRLPEFAALTELLPGPPDGWFLFTLRSTFQPSFQSFMAEHERRSFRESVNRNTLKRFDRLWLKNLYYNLQHAHRWHPIRSLFGKHPNRPAVVVSAGPSLDHCLQSLKQYRSRYILIAVDTAVGALQHAAIDPDYLLSVDAQAANFLHVRPYRGNATVIIDSTVSYLALRHLPGPCYTFYNPLPAASTFLEHLFSGSPGELLFGGSVSTNAFDFAKRLGCSRVFLCGLDLSFPGNQIHARGSALEEAIHAGTHRLLSAEHHNYAQLTAIDRLYLKNRSNQSVPTNDKLLIFYEWYRAQFAVQSETDFVHVDGGGAAFPGVNTIPVDSLEEALKALPMQEIPPASTDTLGTQDGSPVNPLPLMDKLNEALNAAEGLLDRGDSPELATAILRLDQTYGLPVSRILSSGMQNRLLQNMDMSTIDDINEFFNDLRSSVRLHKKLLSRGRQIANR